MRLCESMPLMERYLSQSLNLDRGFDQRGREHCKHPALSGKRRVDRGEDGVTLPLIKVDWNRRSGSANPVASIKKSVVTSTVETSAKPTAVSAAINRAGPAVNHWRFAFSSAC